MLIQGYIGMFPADKGCLNWNDMQQKMADEILAMIQPPTEETEEPKYEYELLFRSEPGDKTKIDGWFPIATDRIRNPAHIQQYIENGLLRKISRA